MTQSISTRRKATPHSDGLERSAGRKPPDSEARLPDAEHPAAGRFGIARWYKGAALVVLNTIVLLVCLELAASVVRTIKNELQDAAEEAVLIGEGAPRERISYYRDQDWAPQLWDDFRLSRKKLRYVPYVGWRRPPFDGKTIKIDQEGVRFTPGADCRPGAYKVFAFGGSTMWGTGSPDWGTIPAYLQAGLAKLRGGPVCVVNFGETAYVSTQGVITLMMRLQAGDVPDMVVFYDGPSDVYAAYQSGRGGAPQNVERLATIFEGRDRFHPLVEWLMRSASFSLVNSVMTRTGMAMPADRPAMSRTATTSVPALTDLVVGSYLRNYTTVSALAEKHQFKFAFFWQPFISMGQKPLTTEEQEIRADVDTVPTYSQLIRSVYATIAKETGVHRNLYDLTHAFDDHAGLLWIDSAHVTPPGNEVLAGKMLAILQARSVATDSTRVTADFGDHRRPQVSIARH